MTTGAVDHRGQSLSIGDPVVTTESDQDGTVVSWSDDAAMCDATGRGGCTGWLTGMLRVDHDGVEASYPTFWYDGRHVALDLERAR